MANYGIGTSADVDYRKAYKEYVQDVAAFNATTDVTEYNQFVRNTTKEQVRYKLSGMQFVQSGEGHEGIAQRPETYTRGIPMKIQRLRMTMTDVDWYDSTQEEINEWFQDGINAANRNIAEWFFEATVRGDNATGSGYGFWNNAGTNTTDWNGTSFTSLTGTPSTYKKNAFTSSHDHYNATGSATLDLEDFKALKKHITEHGYGMSGMGQGTNIKLVMNSNTAYTKLEVLQDWTSSQTNVRIADDISQAGIYNGQTICGMTIALDDWMPDDYLMAVAADVPCLYKRNPKEAKGQGLIFRKGPYEDIPFMDAKWLMRHGFVVGHRGAGAVAKITASAYSTPSAYLTNEEA